jgi:DNA mismatch repair protein MSH6
MEIRQKDAGNKGKEIVRRELGRVFTNGTIVDGEYLSSHDANHCVSIKEFSPSTHEPSVFGICIMDASTGEFQLSYLQDDIIRTRLETLFRQIRPKELICAKVGPSVKGSRAIADNQGNLTVATERILRHILPMNCLRQSFKEGKEFWDSDRTISELGTTFGDDIPAEIASLQNQPTAMEALGGMMFYLQALNLRQDLLTQRNFNIYDPIREGNRLILDGLTLGHMEVLVNNEGGTEGTLLELLQNCATPFGKCCPKARLTELTV